MIKKIRKRFPAVRLDIDRLYSLYGGDVVRCIKQETDTVFSCEFVSVVPERQYLLGHCDQWSANGKWLSMPHGIMDIERELIE